MPHRLTERKRLILESLLEEYHGAPVLLEELRYRVLQRQLGRRPGEGPSVSRTYRSSFNRTAARFCGEAKTHIVPWSVADIPIGTLARAAVYRLAERGQSWVLSTIKSTEFYFVMEQWDIIDFVSRRPAGRYRSIVCFLWSDALNAFLAKKFDPSDLPGSLERIESSYSVSAIVRFPLSHALRVFGNGAVRGKRELPLVKRGRFFAPTREEIRYAVEARHTMRQLTKWGVERAYLLVLPKFPSGLSVGGVRIRVDEGITIKAGGLRYFLLPTYSTTIRRFRHNRPKPTAPPQEKKTSASP